jgi:hypothetical protein
MFKPTPDQRLSMADIVNHPWLQGEIASAEDIKKEFAERKAEIAKKQAELKAKQAGVDFVGSDFILVKNMRDFVGSAFILEKTMRDFVESAFILRKTMGDDQDEESKT